MSNDYQYRASAIQFGFFTDVSRIAHEDGVTDADVAKRAGISTSSYSMMKHGKRPLSIESMVRISEALNLRIIISIHETPLLPDRGR